MTSFFYVVSTAYHISVTALRKCMDTPRKKVFWLRAQSLMHRLLQLFVCLKDLPPIASLIGPKIWKSLRRGLASTADVEDTRRTDLGLLQQLNVQYGAEHCHVATKHRYSEDRVVWFWLQAADDSLGDLHTLHCSQCAPWACSAPRLSLVHPNRESA
jgi:hypothetical protein